jgi:hypothetical protein
MDIVVSTYELRERSFFGLAIMDPDNDEMLLPPQKKILKYAPGSSGTMHVRLKLRFFVDDIIVLQENTTRQLYFSHFWNCFRSGYFQSCSLDTAIMLVGFVLQARQGDYIPEEPSTHYNVNIADLFPSRFINGNEGAPDGRPTPSPSTLMRCRRGAQVARSGTPRAEPRHEETPGRGASTGRRWWWRSF